MTARTLLTVIATFGLAITGRAAEETATPKEPKPGDPAPVFTLPGSDGKTYRLSELQGKTVVLAWFPKAFTGG